MQRSLFLALWLVAGCTDEPRATKSAPSAVATAPPEPEAPTGSSAEDAVGLVRTYFDLIEGGRYADARRLWGLNGSGENESAFANGFAGYFEYHAEIGTPGPIEGAAGSLYVEVPVTVQAVTRGGERLRLAGPVTLRRVNDVPGSTAEQRRWHIQATALARQ